MYKHNLHLSNGTGGEQRDYFTGTPGKGWKVEQVKQGEGMEVELRDYTVGTDGRILKSILPNLSSRHPVCQFLRPWKSQTHTTRPQSVSIMGMRKGRDSVLPMWTGWKTDCPSYKASTMFLTHLQLLLFITQCTLYNDRFVLVFFKWQTAHLEVCLRWTRHLSRLTLVQFINSTNFVKSLRLLHYYVPLKCHWTHFSSFFPACKSEFQIPNTA